TERTVPAPCSRDRARETLLSSKIASTMRPMTHRKAPRKKPILARNRFSCQDLRVSTKEEDSSSDMGNVLRTRCRDQGSLGKIVPDVSATSESYCWCMMPNA